MIGIGPNNPNNKKILYCNCWSFVSSDSKICLKSGNKIIYNNHQGRLKKGDIVEVIVDRNLGNLSFAVNDINYGIACSQIPKDEILYPTVIIYDPSLSVELL